MLNTKRQLFTPVLHSCFVLGLVAITQDYCHGEIAEFFLTKFVVGPRWLGRMPGTTEHCNKPTKQPSLLHLSAKL